MNETTPNQNECLHGSIAPIEGIMALPDSDEHETFYGACAVCSYEMGFNAGELGGSLLKDFQGCAHGNTASSSLLRALPRQETISKGSKCPVCAYMFGLEAGKLEARTLRRILNGTHPRKGTLTLVEAPPLVKKRAAE